ncbi:MAG: response regulator [Myxococcota bacterium]|jgi:CheY-like chemotaxis protein|nr:response regulator [Myxococcota bacterium]MBP8971887.1 response regulator [Myxococcota bacterium]HHW97809.1 response regulator [Oligoflexales bacterium]HQL58056.1 response regulator [Myxococcota bacterium]
MQGKTILLVDDDHDFLDQLEPRLLADGFQVVRAEGQEAAEQVLLAGTHFDMAIVDLMMEYSDSGFVLCHRLKKADTNKPVILVTGVTAETGLEFDAATSEERRWVKADAMLAKPIRYEQLKREISRLLA